MKIHTFLASLVLVGALPCFAAPVAVTNGSFEDPVLSDGEIGFDTPPGWSSGGTENHATGIFGGAEASDGESVYWLNVGFGPSGTLTSDSIGNLAAGTYTLNVDFLFRTDTLSGDSLPDTSFGLSTDGGATLLGTPTTVTDALDVGGAGLISTQSYTLTVASGDPGIGLDTVIHFDFLQNNAGTWNQAAIDNVTLDFAAVPEPGSLGMLVVGGLAILRRHRNL